jgi:hypothetical protein
MTAHAKFKSFLTIIHELGVIQILQDSCSLYWDHLQKMAFKNNFWINFYCNLKHTLSNMLAFFICIPSLHNVRWCWISSVSEVSMAHSLFDIRPITVRSLGSVR